MKVKTRIRKTKQKLNTFITRQLRKTGIFRRLNVSFLILLLTSALFLTFFSFVQYSREINLNLDRYTTMLVQNTGLKIRDNMKEYENTALGFYDNSRILNAIVQNAQIPKNPTPKEQQIFDDNSYLIENRLYSLRQYRKNIVNIQFVTPDYQYHMVEDNGFRRGGTIRNLKKFYNSEFYLLPQQKKGYPVWMDSREQMEFFYKNEQNVYGFANTVTMGIAVYEPSTRDFLGVLLFNIDLSSFTGAVDTIAEEDAGNTFLVGKDGVLCGFSPRISAPSFPKAPELFTQMQETKRDIERIQINGQKMLFVYEQVPDSEMYVCYIARLEDLLKNTLHIRNLCILVLITTVIACFILSYYVTISISNPLKKLNDAMKKAGSGKWAARYANSGHDEITDLGDRFNEMAENTNMLIDQVYLSEIHRQKMLLSLQNARLDAMLMQINPHFLYNTLDIIRWEAMYEAGGESAVTRMIEQFSRLCRLGMKTGGNTIPLKDGIEHASIYIDVINFRHKDKISLILETEVDDESLYVPQFMLQPLMENAVVHAFGDSSRGCSIRIHSYIESEILHIIVEDNGRGMSLEELTALRASLKQDDVSQGSIGLINVNQRIRLFYGDPYGIEIESCQEQGTRIYITLPLRRHSENMTDKTKGGENL